MSSPNVDLGRSIYAAWESGDFGSADWAHPEIEYEYADGPAPGRWTGPAAMSQGYRTWLSSWEDFRVKAAEYRAIDDERVFVLTQPAGRDKASRVDAAQMRSNAAALFHVRDSKVTRLVLYWDRDHAFADLGLAPEGDAA